ncbi:hypothetical protein HDU86_004076 [Geranomyces michiganensis]|nr:hypothetical protein HDU86_004076 [Geranomyces michiganensis]
MSDRDPFNNSIFSPFRPIVILQHRATGNSEPVKWRNLCKYLKQKDAQQAASDSDFDKKLGCQRSELHRCDY